MHLRCPVAVASLTDIARTSWEQRRIAAQLRLLWYTTVLPLAHRYTTVARWASAWMGVKWRAGGGTAATVPAMGSNIAKSIRFMSRVRLGRTSARI